MAVPKKKTESNPGLECQALLEAASLAQKAGAKEKALAFLKEAAAIPQHLAQNFFAQGLLFTKLGDLKKAIEAQEKAIEIRPAFAPYQLSLGRNYLQAKRLPDAIGAFERATLLEPGKAKPFLSLALACFAAGKSSLGRKALKNYFSRSLLNPLRKGLFFLKISGAAGQGFFTGLLNPDLPVKCGHILSKAKVLIRFDQRQKAVVLLEKALEGYPHHPALVVLLAKQLIFLENIPKAETFLREALKQYPGNFSLIVSLSELLSLGRVGEALSLLETVPEEEQNSPIFWNALGHVLFRDNKGAKAIPYFERAAPKIKNPSEFYNTYARALGALGRMDEAELIFKKSIKADQTFAPGYTGLAKMGKLSPGDALFDQLIRKINNPYLPQKSRCLLNFSAGFSFEKAKEFDNAFSHFRAANSLRDVHFCKEEWTKKVEDLKTVFDASFFKKTQGFGNSSKTPIFIVGMPRSATTLTEQILAVHPKVFGGGERGIMNVIISDFQKKIETGVSWPFSAKFLTKPGILEMADQYLDDIGRVDPDAPRVTDKMPGNFWQLGLVATLFPKAKIIHCRRDPLDTCLSNYFQAYLTFHPYAFRLETLGFYYKLYQAIMAHWHKVLPGKILDFDYEETVSDPKSQIQKLLKFCDLEWHEDCLNFHKAKTTVQTASFAQVRKPIYKTSTNKWKHYRTHLGPLKDALK